MAMTTLERADRKPASLHADLLKQPGGPTYSPFDLRIEPMERLLLIPLENGADEVYHGFEPQVFDDDVHGTGMVIIAWRLDGHVDVYHQSGLMLDPAGYSIAGKGLCEMLERPLDGARFEVGASGVSATITFDDKLGRRVEIDIVERGTKPCKPFSLLAPMGSAAQSPNALPLLFLHGFYFVRRAASDVSVRIDGHERRTSHLPLPLDASRMYFIRYADDPVIATLNPAYSGRLEPLDVSNPARARQGGVEYDLIEDGGLLRIAGLSRVHKGHRVALDFTPAVPDILSLPQGADRTGTFRITGGKGAGELIGTYRVERSGDRVSLHLAPSGGWRPDERKWSLRFLYRVARVFREWPKSYEWMATVNVFDPLNVTMRSSWHRKGQAS